MNVKLLFGPGRLAFALWKNKIPHKKKRKTLERAQGKERRRGREEEEEPVAGKRTPGMYLSLFLSLLLFDCWVGLFSGSSFFLSFCLHCWVDFAMGFSNFCVDFGFWGLFLGRLRVVLIDQRSPLQNPAPKSIKTLCLIAGLIYIYRRLCPFQFISNFWVPEAHCNIASGKSRYVVFNFIIILWIVFPVTEESAVIQH